MYSHSFTAMIDAGAAGQPGWLHGSILFATGIARGNLALFNTLFALTQLAIGLGLLHRRTVRPALILSIGWAIVVWWFGEAFGGLLSGTAVPLTGAPGAVFLYALVGLLAWPGARPTGLLSARAARWMWAALWLAMACLWLAPASGGVGFAVVLAGAVASAAIGLGVAARKQPHALLAAAVAVNVVYWFAGQGVGSIFAGDATDPNAAPLFCLLALAMLPAVAADPRAQRLGVGQQLGEEPLARGQEALSEADRVGVLVVDRR
jgi:hypothetical protein